MSFACLFCVVLLLPFIEYNQQSKRLANRLAITYSCCSIFQMDFFVDILQVANMAQLNNIYLRTGCFCNPGACQRHLKLSDNDLMAHFNVNNYSLEVKHTFVYV